jgi:hypothetical protein
MSGRESVTDDNRTTTREEADLLAAGPLERMHLASVLGQVGQRLTSIEASLAQGQKVKPPSSSVLLDLTKVLFGGWPAFGLLFLLLFHSPLREALNAIPEKVKAADEIGFPGVSLKSTLRVEAEKIGASRLSESLPSLSAAAVEMLLRSSRNYNGLIAYGSGSSGLVERVWLPSEAAISTLDELQRQGLIEIESAGQVTNSAGLRAAVEDFKRKHVGRDAGRGTGAVDDALVWELTPPERTETPRLSWRLTDLGKQAVDVVLKAVSQQLMPSATRGPGSS